MSVLPIRVVTVDPAKAELISIRVGVYLVMLVHSAKLVRYFWVL